MPPRSLGARNGRLHVEKLHRSRGFSWARVRLTEELTKSPEPTLANCAAILPRVYSPAKMERSTPMSLISRRGIVLFTDPRRDESVTLTLAAELGKGAHYYDISRLREQLSVPPRPLPDNMKRFYLAGPHSYRYLFDFAKARVLGRYVITSNNIVTLFQSEAVARKP